MFSVVYSLSSERGFVGEGIGTFLGRRGVGVTGESQPQQTSNNLPHKKPVPNVTSTTVQHKGQTVCGAPVDEKDTLFSYDPMRDFMTVKIFTLFSNKFHEKTKTSIVYKATA